MPVQVIGKSLNLLAFGTPSGRYGFKCLSYGIDSGSEFFWRGVTSIISEIPGIVNSLDNFVIWGTIYRNMTNA